jgi:hypothetical protein
MAIVLDAGALIAIERADRRILKLLDRAQRDRVALRTSAAVVAQVWRDGARQARVSSILRAVLEVPLDHRRARAIGVVLAAARHDDVVDGSIVDVSVDGDLLVTSDPDDIAKLADAANRRIRIVPI